MRLLNDSLAELVHTVQVEPDDAYIKAVDKDGLVAAFAGKGIHWSPEMLSRTSEAPAPTPASEASNVQPQPPAPLPQDPGAEASPASTDPFEQFKQMRG